MFSRVWPGRPYPLGATWDGIGVNFALYSENATKVELCLFDSPEAQAESVRIALPSVTNQIWHCYLPDAKPGQLYGYRVHGPDAPHKGWNCGVEGPTSDQAINQLRQRQQLNFLTTLFLSQGVPMLLAGDEVAHTQEGNNNGYCQDSPLSWINWELRLGDYLLQGHTLAVLRLELLPSAQMKSNP